MTAEPFPRRRIGDDLERLAGWLADRQQVPAPRPRRIHTEPPRVPTEAELAALKAEFEAKECDR